MAYLRPARPSRGLCGARPVLDATADAANHNGRSTHLRSQKCVNSIEINKRQLKQAYTTTYPSDFTQIGPARDTTATHRAGAAMEASTDQQQRPHTHMGKSKMPGMVQRRHKTTLVEGWDGQHENKSKAGNIDNGRPPRPNSTSWECVCVARAQGAIFAVRRGRSRRNADCACPGLRAAPMFRAKASHSVTPRDCRRRLVWKQAATRLRRRNRAMCLECPCMARCINANAEVADLD